MTAQEKKLYSRRKGMAGVVVSLLLFFTAFNLLEASLPSLVAKMAPVTGKGTAMGFFTSSQFLGAFVGGVLGGWAHQLAGSQAVFLLGAGAALLWFLVALGMSNPRYFSSQLLKVGPLEDEEARQLGSCLRDVPGVAEAEVMAGDGVVYLKVDKEKLDQAALSRFAAAQA